jgi:hypothetical protein
VCDFDNHNVISFLRLSRVQGNPQQHLNLRPFCRGTHSVADDNAITTIDLALDGSNIYPEYPVKYQESQKTCKIFI